MTSLLAPSWAPASRTWETSSSSSGTVSSPPAPRASAAMPSRKSWTFPAIRSASGIQPSTGQAEESARSDIQQSPSLESAPQRDLVRVLQVPADRKAAGRPGHPDAHRLDQPGQVSRGGLSLEVRVG